MTCVVKDCGGELVLIGEVRGRPWPEGPTVADRANGKPSGVYMLRCGKCLANHTASNSPRIDLRGFARLPALVAMALGFVVPCMLLAHAWGAL